MVRKRAAEPHTRDSGKGEQKSSKEEGGDLTTRGPYPADSSLTIFGRKRILGSGGDLDAGKKQTIGKKGSSRFLGNKSRSISEGSRFLGRPSLVRKKRFI